jgi:hypothetical protein
MKKYLVRDILEAEPMPMNEYVKLVQKEVDDVPNTDGYHVKYANGKTTWLEKNDFEKNAIPYDDLKERLAVELQDLEEKAIKLKEAFKSHKLDNLTPINKALLGAQLDLMSQYHRILFIRNAMDKDIKQRDSINMVPFGTALATLKQGWPVSRITWQNREDKTIIVNLVPSYVDKVTLLNTELLSEQTKHSVEEVEFSHIYAGQCISINNQMEATSWSPSIEDIFAEDWIILTNAKRFITKNTEVPEEQGQKNNSSSHD